MFLLCVRSSFLRFSLADRYLELPPAAVWQPQGAQQRDFRRRHGSHGRLPLTVSTPQVTDGLGGYTAEVLYSLG